MPKFKDTASLFTYIQKAVDSALDNEVFEAVKEAEKEAVQEEVYDAYSPKKYRRRKGQGGLLDDANVVKVGGAASNGVLVVENITPPNPYLNGVNARGGVSTTPSGQPITGLVEYYIFNRGGYGYDYWTDGFPREFIAGTVERLQASSAHKDALKRGIARMGINVK